MEQNQNSSSGNSRRRGSGRRNRNNRRRGNSSQRRNNSRNSQGRSFSKNNSSRRRSNRGGRRSRRRNENTIDINKFIASAKTPQKEEKFIPSWKYSELKVDRNLKQNIQEKGYELPTRVQEKAIPAVMEGKDVLGIANTGTGKTAAFLIPLIQKALNSPSERMLIITPTRELAEQISDELYMLAVGLKMSMALCIGGASITMQLSRLRRDPIFVVGTPGRLLDHVNRKSLNLSRFNTIVLDEVDRMLDMGFINDIEKIIDNLANERQSLFFSATMNDKISRIIKKILKKDYVNVSVKTGETAEYVEQTVLHFADNEDKIDKLKRLLASDKLKKTLVFINMKWHVNKIENQLRRQGFKVTSLHGDKRQNQRSRAVSAFKEGKADILLATDVAARGLDIDDITHVVNYDIPHSYEEYVHRIGRTGRAKRSGTSITFVPQKKNVVPGRRNR